MLKKETNNWDITIDDVVKINIDDGDVLLVELPPQTDDLPLHALDIMYSHVTSAFESVFSDKDVKILVVPTGMKVEIIQSSKLKDK